jgi:hypothetical protein
MSLMPLLPAWWVSVERALAGDVSDRIDLTLVQHAGRVSDATGQPHWAAGVASPSRGEIIVSLHGPDGSRTDMESLVKHEMAHVILHRATGGVALPRWFHEGVAESFTDRIDFRRTTTLAEAVFGRGVPNLERLEQSFFQDDAVAASVAYAAARDFVQFLRFQDAGGADFRQLLLELRRGKSIDGATVAAYGVTLQEQAKRWREGLLGRFAWYPVVASGAFPFLLLTPLVLVAWFRRRESMRRAWARLELEDLEERRKLFTGDLIRSPHGLFGLG